MSNFLSEVSSVTGLPFDSFGGAFRVVMSGDSAIYIEGIKGIIAFGPERVSLRAGKKILEILGGELCVKLLSKDDCAVSGKITSVGIK